MKIFRRCVLLIVILAVLSLSCVVFTLLSARAKSSRNNRFTQKMDNPVVPVDTLDGEGRVVPLSVQKIYYINMVKKNIQVVLLVDVDHLGRGVALDGGLGRCRAEYGHLKTHCRSFLLLTYARNARNPMQLRSPSRQRQWPDGSGDPSHHRRQRHPPQRSSTYPAPP